MNRIVKYFKTVALFCMGLFAICGNPLPGIYENHGNLLPGYNKNRGNLLPGLQNGLTRVKAIYHKGLHGFRKTSLSTIYYSTIKEYTMRRKNSFSPSWRGENFRKIFRLEEVGEKFRLEEVGEKNARWLPDRHGCLHIGYRVCYGVLTEISYSGISLTDTKSVSLSGQDLLYCSKCCDFDLISNKKHGTLFDCL